MGIVKIKTTLFSVCIADTFNNRKLLIKAEFILQRDKLSSFAVSILHKEKRLVVGNDIEASRYLECDSLIVRSGVLHVH